jgi:tetratricopeptide (TPR) repeat protein
MKDNLLLLYLSLLVLILAGAAFFLFRQIFKTRRKENQISRLQKQVKEKSATAKEYYELASLYLDKRLYVQGAKLLQQALKFKNIEPENRALIYNAMGYSYFAQEQYDLAIRQYKEAIKLYPEYVIGLNNLANAYEQKKLTAQAIDTYEQVLEYDPENKTANRQLEKLRKRFVKEPTQEEETSQQ